MKKHKVMACKSFTGRAVSLLLTFAMLIGMLNASLVPVNAESAGDGFALTIKWNGADQDKVNYVYDSQEKEDRLVRLKVLYENKSLDYAYGKNEIVITVPGIKGANRDGNDMKPVAIAADEASSTSKFYDWSYTYSSMNDTFVFTNNFVAESNHTFEGSFEIIWEINSRESVNDLSKTLQAKLRTSNNEEALSNEIYYYQSRQRDEYEITVAAAQMYSSEGLTGNLYQDTTEENYIWVHYSLNGKLTEKARSVKNAERFDLYFLEGTIVSGAGLVKTNRVREIDGINYECWSVSRDITIYNNSWSYFDNIVAAYPIERYGESNGVPNALMYVEMVGTYNDEDEEVVLAQADFEVSLDAYDFIPMEGTCNLNPAGVVCWGSYNSYIRSHCDDCYNHGAINSAHVSDGSHEYESTFYISWYLSCDDTNRSYSLEFADDIIDVELNDGSTRQLADDEYHLTNLKIPSVSSVNNINSIAIEADKYEVLIYIRHANGEFEDEPFSTTTLQSVSQVISLPDDTVAVKAVVKDLDVTVRGLSFKVDYALHAHTDDINLNNGRLINSMYFKIYGKSEGVETWINGSPSTTYSDERDLDTYGEKYERRSDSIHILEIPNQFSQSVAFKSTGEDMANYYMEADITTRFDISEGNELTDFSMYTILPEGAKLQVNANTAETLSETLAYGAVGADVAFIKEHSTVNIIENYKDSGRIYVVIHFDFSDSPIVPDSVSIKGIPLFFQKIDNDSNIITYTFRAVSLINQSGKWYATSVDNTSQEGGIWSDIDGDGDLQEYAARNYSNLKKIIPEHSNVQFTKAVSTSLSNGFVQPVYDNMTESYNDSEIPFVYKNYEYAYKLRLSNGENITKNIIFVDVLEKTDLAEWQGTFLRVDYSEAERVMNATPIVYYSSQEEEVPEGKDPPDFTTGGWTTVKPDVVKSVAVWFEDGVLDSGKNVSVDIYMKAPNEKSYEFKITDNKSSVYCERYDVDNINQFVDKGWIASNSVPVKLTPFMGFIKLSKVDSLSKAKLSGATFELYEKSSETPNPSSDNLITEMTTSDDGTVTVQVPYGSYYLVETEAPLGYQRCEDYIPVELDFDEPDMMVTTEVENDRKPGQVYVKKVSDRNAKTFLPGAKFDVYRVDDDDDDSNDVRVKEGLVTDENGEIVIDGLAWGEYYLVETKAPDGYEISSEKISLVIKDSNDAGRAETKIVVNSQKTTYVVLEKKEMRENGTLSDTCIDGAAYQLYNSKNQLLGTYMTDDEGRIYVENLTFGDYYFKETIAAQGYELSSDKISFTVDNRHTESPLIVETSDKRLLGRVWMQKKDDNGEVVEGAVYALFDADSESERQIDESRHDAVTTFTTDSEGIIEIDELYWGNYYLRELKAPLGYELSDEKIMFAVERTNVNNLQILKVEDKRGKGSVKLTKISEEPDENGNDIYLQGAVYTLYRNDGTVYRDDLVTDENGELLVEDIDWGSYYLLEKTAPENYGLSEEKLRFSVNYLTATKVQLLTAKDPELSGQVTVTKKIKISDIVSAHGDPAFIFRLDGKDNSGRSYTFYKTVVFNEQYVKDYAEANPDAEYVELSKTFVGLVYGKWTVSEMNTNRYIPASVDITNGSGTVDNDSKKVTFTINSSSMDCAVTYTNDKYFQSSTSHSEMMVNVLKKSKVLTSISADIYENNIITSETLERSRIDVYAMYDDGSKIKLADDAYTLDTETFDETKNGEFTVTASYSEDGVTCKDTFVVRVCFSDNFTWIINSTPVMDSNGVLYDGTATLTGYLGDSTVLSIPEVVSGERTMNDYGDNQTTGEYTYRADGKFYKVTGITGHTDSENNTEMPMYGTQNIVTMLVPAGLETIGNYAFYNSTVLENLIIEENSNLKTIGECAFYGCSALNTALYLPKVETIDEYAFYNCANLTSLSFGEASCIREIGGHAFQGCTAMTGDLYLPKVETIGEYAFYGCNKLTSLSFGEDSCVVSIGDRAFYSCTAMTGDLYLPKVETIGEYAFYGCKKLTSLSFGEASCIREIGGHAFQGCTAMTGNLYLPKVETIGQYAFYSCNKLTSLSFGEDSCVVSIGEYAFYNCTAMTGVLYLPKVETIGQYAFYNCQRLTSLSFGEDASVSSIGERAFQNCRSLRGELVIPNTLETIEQYTFYQCDNLHSLKFEDNSTLKVIHAYAFANCRSLSEKLTIPKSVNLIDWYTFQSCQSLTSLEFEEGSELKHIAQFAFAGCIALSGELVLPKNLRIIGQCAFQNCKNLTALEFEEGAQLATIGPAAFINCTGLSGVVKLPQSLDDIYTAAFSGCTNIQCIVLAQEYVSSDACLTDLAADCFKGVKKCCIHGEVNLLSTDLGCTREDCGGEVEVIKEPTCTETGLQIVHCKFGETFEQIIPMTEHNIQGGVCTNCGLSINVEVQTSNSLDGFNRVEMSNGIAKYRPRNIGRKNSQASITFTITNNVETDYTFGYAEVAEVYDPLTATLDGETILCSVLGNSDKRYKTVHLSPGTHTLTFTYSKNGSLDGLQNSVVYGLTVPERIFLFMPLESNH